MWDVIILVVVVVVVFLFFIFGSNSAPIQPTKPQKVSFHPDPDLQEPSGLELSDNKPISWNDAYQSVKSQNDLTGQLGDGMPVPWLQALETVSKTFTGPPGGPMYHGELPLSEPY